MEEIFVIVDENSQVVGAKHKFADAAVYVASLACVDVEDVENLDSEGVREVTGYKIESTYID